MGDYPHRFCPKGHDKFAPKGGHIRVNSKGRIYLQCAVCTRTGWNQRYHDGAYDKHYKKAKKEK